MNNYLFILIIFSATEDTLHFVAKKPQIDSILWQKTYNFPRPSHQPSPFNNLLSQGLIPSLAELQKVWP